MTAERQTSDPHRPLALAGACALGNFAGTRLSGGRGLPCAVFRLRLHRLGTAAAASAVSRFRWLFGGVGDLLERGTTLWRSPPGQHIALQSRVVPAGRLASLQRERVELAVAQGALETTRRDYARLQRDILAGRGAPQRGATLEDVSDTAKEPSKSRNGRGGGRGPKAVETEPEGDAAEPPTTR